MAVLVDASSEAAEPRRSRSSDGFDLADFARLLWRAKWVVLAITLAATTMAVRMVIRGGAAYNARMVVQTAGQTGGLGGALGQMGALVGLQTATEDREFSQFQAMIKSLVVAERLQRKYGIMQEIYADSWDATNKRWVEPTGWGHDFDAWFNELRHQPRWTPPSIYDLAGTLEGQIKVKRSNISPSIYEITYKGGNREFAVRFLDMVYREAEAAMREERKTRVTEQARYLRSRIETTPIVEYRLSLIALLSEQDKTLMLLESNLPFATIVVDPASAPLRPESRSLEVYGFVGVVGGFVMAIVLVLIFHLTRDIFRK